jgi:CheY-like chemotaxis protein
MKTCDSILLIDDDDSTNLYHKVIIKMGNFAREISTVEEGQKALKILNEKSFDYVFLDLNMPGMTGWDVLDGMLENEDFLNSGSKLYILTASVNPDDNERSKNYNMVSGFLNKPLTEEVLKSL